MWTVPLYLNEPFIGPLRTPEKDMYEIRLRTRTADEGYLYCLYCIDILTVDMLGASPFDAATSALTEIMFDRLYRLHGQGD